MQVSRASLKSLLLSRNATGRSSRGVVIVARQCDNAMTIVDRWGIAGGSRWCNCARNKKRYMFIAGQSVENPAQFAARAVQASLDTLTISPAHHAALVTLFSYQPIARALQL